MKKLNEQAIKIGKNCIIAPENNRDWNNFVYGKNVIIGSDVYIDKNVTLGNNVTIDSLVKIGNDSIIGNMVKIGTGTQIGLGSKIGNVVNIIGAVTIGNFVTISDGVTIEMFSHICSCVNIGKNANIGICSRIGNNSSIGNRVTIGNNVRICNLVNVGDNVTITETPLQIQGSKDICYPYNYSEIGIGDMHHPFDLWISNLDELEYGNKYTSKQREEYTKYIYLMHEWMLENFTINENLPNMPGVSTLGEMPIHLR
jgi:UDP-3-O-[3-hydroxymyristoyl] glucosamine N-acyltransferase